jgi:hypothetical protein
MDTLGERLGHAIGLAGLELKEASEAAGLKSTNHAGQLVRGENENPKIGTVLALLRMLRRRLRGLTLDWLVLGEGPGPERRGS